MSFEIRETEDKDVDEIIAKNVSFHLERMDNDQWLLIVSDGKDDWYIDFFNKAKNTFVDIQVEKNR